MSQSILRRFIILVAVMVVVVQAIFPVKERIRYGKDLAGGVTLTYRVQQNPADPDKKATLTRVIEVIRNRIDPQGQLDITIVPQGEDRLEITMPLPSEEVKALRKKVDDAIASMGDSHFTKEAILTTLGLPAAERASRIKSLSEGDSNRQTKLDAAAAAFDSALAARKVLNEAPADANRDELISKAGEAEFARDEAVEAVMQTAVSPEDLRHALQQSSVSRSLNNGSAATKVLIPSPRQVAIEALETEHPGAKDAIQNVVSLHDAYAKARKTLDDPQDLIRMLRGAGVLTFRITTPVGKHPEEARLRRELRELGPENARANDARWFKINDLSAWYDSVQDFQRIKENPAAYFEGRGGYVVEERLGDYYMLCWDTPDTTFKTSESEGVEGAHPSTDNIGRNAIAFNMNTLGSTRLGALTAAHVKQQMAILLDDQVYTAPTLQSAISDSGQITGSFSKSEIEYIVRVLAAGSLQAKLGDSPIGQSIVGPSFGLDNLRKGLYAGAVAGVVCSALMVVYYFSCGAIAVFGLAINILIIVGVMALNHAAFTLPGIAGVILTFGMAVDANVLIYERMREELMRGADLREAVRLGYGRAMPAVVDGNLTNLIVCVVLATFGTPEIKGFGITMSIGTLATLFAQLFVTRLIFDILVDKLHWRKTSMLPMAVPPVQAIFSLKIRWMRMRSIFYAIFGLLTALSITMIVVRGSKMLDTEFVGGTEVIIQLKKDPNGVPLKLTRAEVSKRLDSTNEGSTELSKNVAQKLRTAEIVVVDPAEDGVTSDTFRIRVQNDQEFEDTNTDALASALRSDFQDVIDTPPGLTFKGSDQEKGNAFVKPIVTTTLGESIDRADTKAATGDDLGGAAVLIQDLEPRPTMAALQARLERMRSNSAYNDIASHERRLVLIEGTPEAVKTAAIIVTSPDVSYLADISAWTLQMAGREWELERSTLSDPPPDLTLRSFDASVAASFAEKAITSIVISVVLIIIYCWVRFASFRFSLAAIIPTLLDCFMAVGLIAVAEMVCETHPKLGNMIGLMPFKIDLTVVAAVLTILGYSINDKIIVLDRIRENRGKLTYVSRKIVNQSVNQTLSRTILTSSTTFISTIVLYIAGGEGVRAFAYALSLGVVIGTISSIMLAAPIAWSKKGDLSNPEDDAGHNDGTIV